LQNQPIHYDCSNSSRDGKYDLDHRSCEHSCFLYSLRGFSFVPSSLSAVLEVPDEGDPGAELSPVPELCDAL
jgi:hypothetical protein